MKRNTLVKITTLIFSLFLTLQVNSTNILAQETSNPELEELKKKKEIAETKQAIAEAKKAEIEAKFPIPDADSLKGSTDVKGDLIESQIQAYKAMEIMSEEIAKNIQSKGISKLYVFNETDYEKITAYKNLIQQLDVINSEYTRCNPTGVPPPGPAAVGLANIFLNSLQLLKTDTSITGTSFDIDNEAVWASLANKLSSKGIFLSNPFISNINSVAITFGGSNLTAKLGQAEISLSKLSCVNGGDRLKQQIDSIFRKLKTELNLAVTDSTPQTTTTTTITTTTPPNKTQVEEVVDKTEATSPAQNPNSWFSYLITEQIIETMQANNIFWIKIRNIKAGGNLRIKSHPLVDLFRGGSSIKFSGGGLISYYIFNNEGKIIDSRVVSSYTPYKKSSQIK